MELTEDQRFELYLQDAAEEIDLDPVFITSREAAREAANQVLVQNREARQNGNTT